MNEPLPRNAIAEGNVTKKIHRLSIVSVLWSNAGYYDCEGQESNVLFFANGFLMVESKYDKSMGQTCFNEKDKIRIAYGWKTIKSLNLSVK